MKTRFLADADLNHDIVKGLVRREPGIDFRTAIGGELCGLSDREVLTLAASEGRISTPARSLPAVPALPPPAEELLLHFCQGGLGGGDLAGDLAGSGAAHNISAAYRALRGNRDLAQL